jgi:1-acyl-sn-glycerol-3-phosphate acyltransferase
MRRVLSAILLWLTGVLVRFYYPRRSVEGAEHLPARGPALYVLNHPNGLMDPMVLRAMLSRPIRFLAKSTFYDNPFGRLAMDAFGSLPVYRAEDADRARDGGGGGGGGGDRAARNDRTFVRCHAELAAGAELAVFPEGASHSDPRLRPLKTGAARIVLSAAATAEGAAVIPVIPAGLHYQDKSQLRSGVHLVVGAPIDLGPHRARHATDPRGAVDGLTDEIRARLDAVVLQAESRELLAGIARVASWTASDAGDDAPDRHHARTRELLAAYARLKTTDPDRVERVAETARQYARALAHLGVDDPWGLEVPRITPAGVAAALGRVVLMAPAAALGFLQSFVPYRLADMLARRISGAEDDILSTVRLIAGTTFLVAAWLVEAAVLGWKLGAGWGVLALATAVPAGYAALRLGETVRDLVEAFRHLTLRAAGASDARSAVERRRQLAAEVARALREVPP